jgi:hypothetical protein
MVMARYSVLERRGDGEMFQCPLHIIVLVPEIGVLKLSSIDVEIYCNVRSNLCEAHWTLPTDIAISAESPQYCFVGHFAQLCAHTI